MSEQRPKTTRCKLCCKKLGTSRDVKGFAIGLFLKRFVGQIHACQMSAKSIDVQKIPTKSAVFNRLFFGEFSPKISSKLPRNRLIFPQICL